MFIDISEGKVDFFKISLENLSVPISIIDTTGRIIYVNNEFYDLYKIEHRKLINVNFKEYFIIQNRIKIKEAFKICKLEGHSSCEAITLAGLPVLVYFKLFNVNKEEYINVSLTNISEIKIDEEKLNFIFENSKAAMLLLDKDGRWIKVNKAFEKDTGFNKQELLGKRTIEQPCTTDETIRALKNLWKYVIDQKIEAESALDVPWKRKDGSILIHYAHEAPYKVEGEGRLYSGVDVTKDRVNELNLKKAIYYFGSVLKEIASGNFSVRVDLDSTGDEYKPIAEDINKMISAIKNYIAEIERRDLNLNTSVSLFASTLSYATSGDLTKKVNLDLIPSEYRPIGQNINLMIESLDKLLTTDYLTHLLNRRALYQHMSLKERYGSLIMLDIDNFKYINDTYGHDVGDETLKTVAQIVLQNTRDGDLSVRLGGDEILIYLPRTNINLAYMIAERIRLLIEKEGISASFGIAYGKLNDELIRIADNEMYKAKKIGKNKISVHNSLISNKDKQ
jgi:diguanylate cyclase (GGDEF)-like protein/PAS domain S-box-containing protein